MKTKLTMNESCRLRFTPVVQEIQRLLESEDSPVLVAIDGNAASGKTTLGYYLKEIFDCNLFHMDDFFLQDSQRTEERGKEVGGNVDYERFWLTVLKPLLRKESVCYRPFSCKKKALEEPVELPFRRLNIVEGSYSQHPYFGEIYKLKVFMELPKEVQIERIRLRNGEEMLERFVSEWIPKENAYFKEFGIREKSMVVSWQSV